LDGTSPILCAVLGGGYKKSGYDTLLFINQKSLDHMNVDISILFADNDGIIEPLVLNPIMTIMLSNRA
jgi:hypothetical protein